MLIDLTAPLNERTPVYPGDPATEIGPAATLERDGYLVHRVCCGTHLGTHMDAPSHMIEGGPSLHEIPLDRFTGRAICIRVESAFTLELVEGASIEEGDIVFFHTGMSDRYHDEAYFHDYPPLSPEVARHLVKRKVKLVGTDTCSPDGPDPGFPIHKILLGNGVLILENLVNLRLVAGRRFEVYAFPIRYELDAAPVRVVARL